MYGVKLAPELTREAYPVSTWYSSLNLCIQFQSLSSAMASLGSESSLSSRSKDVTCALVSLWPDEKTTHSQLLEVIKGYND
jgi:hypothetical protein